MKIIYAILTVSLLMFGCNKDEFEATDIKMRVSHLTQECTGSTNGTCLLVQQGERIGSDSWELFYFANSIDGFTKKLGYTYDLLVRVSEVKSGSDASSLKYQLIDIESSERIHADESVTEATVLSPDLSTCACFCGGYFIKLQGIQYRFYADSLPENNLNLATTNLPLDVTLDWDLVPPSTDCGADDIISIKSISQR